MQKTVTVAIIASLILMSFAGFQPSLAENPGGDVIGEYHQFGATEDLTSNHVSWDDGDLVVAGPAFANKLEVETAFLEEELGDWSSDEQFTVGEGVVKFESREATFTGLSLGVDSVFTWGSESLLRFQERPMWVSMDQDGHGEQINLTMSDGDSSGQQIYVSKEWLWGHGIHRPNATHEDGSVLNVTRTQDGSGFLVDVHHFSRIEILSAERSVLGQSGDGEVKSHDGDVLWYPDDSTLEIDVGGTSSDTYTLYVEKDWIDLYVPSLALREHTWANITVKDIEYLVIGLTQDQLPTTVVFEPFSLSEIPLYSKGDRNSVLLWAVNEAFFDKSTPMQIHLGGSEVPELVVNHTGQYRLQINDAWLEQFNISEPIFRVDGKPHEFLPTHDGSGWFILLEGNTTVQLLDGDPVFEYQLEQFAKEVWVYLDAELETAEVIKPLYIPWFDINSPSVSFRIFTDCDCPEAIGQLELITPDGWENVTLPASNESIVADVPNPTIPDPELEPEGILEDLETGQWYICCDGSGGDIHVPPPGTLVAAVLEYLLDDLHAYGEGGGPGVPIEVPWEVLEEVLGLVDLPLPDFDLRETSSTVLCDDENSDHEVIDPILPVFLLPNEQGDLVFTINYRVGECATMGDTIRVEIEDDEGVVQAFEEKVRRNDPLVWFESMPAIFGASYSIGVKPALQPVQILVDDVGVPAEDPEDCGPANLNWEFRPGNYERNWTDVTFSDPDYLGSGGWTYFWEYTQCDGTIKEYTSKFSFGFWSANDVEAGGFYGMDVGEWANGTEDWHQWYDDGIWDYYWFHALMVNPTFFYREPLQGDIEFQDPVETDVFRGPIETDREESCTSDFLYPGGKKVVKKVAKNHKWLGWIVDVLPDLGCKPYNIDFGEELWDEPGQWLEIKTRTNREEVTTGRMNYKYNEPAPEFELDLKAIASYEGRARACKDCQAELAEGGHYYGLHPPMVVRGT